MRQIYPDDVCGDVATLIDCLVLGQRETSNGFQQVGSLEEERSQREPVPPVC